MSKVISAMGDDIVVLSTPGVAIVILMKSKASEMFKLHYLQQDDEDDASVVSVARRIAKECKTIQVNSSTYEPLTKDLAVG